jgi:hypothetical protein
MLYGQALQLRQGGGNVTYAAKKAGQLLQV